ncbi:MAG: DUF309 domain-containing protein [Methylobacteriaceae bacterium]|nr:DUF309 domain-containing protein [Methylobacteriaceae bacterium]
MELPRWAYRPGDPRGPDREPLERAKALLPDRFTAPPPADHPAIRYGLALSDGSFFWEAHEVLEAAWTAAPPNGRDRAYLRAAIQVANAGLKRAIGRPRAALRLLADAQTWLAANPTPADPAGFGAALDADALALAIKAAAADLAVGRQDGAFPRFADLLKA